MVGELRRGYGRRAARPRPGGPHGRWPRRRIFSRRSGGGRRVFGRARTSGRPIQSPNALKHAGGSAAVRVRRTSQPRTDRHGNPGEPRADRGLPRILYTHGDCLPGMGRRPCRRRWRHRSGYRRGRRVFSFAFRAGVCGQPGLRGAHRGPCRLDDVFQVRVLLVHPGFGPNGPAYVQVAPPPGF